MRVCACVQQCNPQNLANIVWAYATLEVPPGVELLRASANRLLQLLPESKPQALANMAWAFATLAWNPGVCVCARARTRARARAPAFTAIL